MKNKIRNFKQLQQEEQRLLQLRQLQGEIVRLDYQQWKVKLSPVGAALGALKKMAVPASDHSLLARPFRTMVRFITRLMIPKNAGWLMRWLVPLAVKNYSSYKFSKWGNDLVEKVKDWRTTKKNKKAKNK